MSYPYKRMRVKGRLIDRHRYVMEQHLGRKLRSDEIVHHINEDTQDDRIENLEVTTRSDHARGHVTEESIDRLVLSRQVVGEETYNSVFTDEDIRDIRRRLDAGEGGKDLAEEYGVAPQTISKIKLRKSWKHC